MSSPVIVFSIYFGIGLVLMIVAVASPGKEKRTKGFEDSTFSTGDEFDALLLIFIALAWPVWLLSVLGKKKPKE